MHIYDILKNSENEKPLDRILENGGYTSIFRTIGCVGDSLSSGEFEVIDNDGNALYVDMYEYSWGQFIARMTGSKVYNFSCGGMTAEVYINSFAESKGYWDTDKACQAYIIALGVNELVCQRKDVGSIDDICIDDWRKNAHTFVGYYAAIVQRLKEIQPDAKFFFVTMPQQKSDDEIVVSIRDKHAEVLEQMTKVFSNSYLIDLRKYAPTYDEEFCKLFYLRGHLNPCGYMLTAQMIASYIDYIVRHNSEDFKYVGFIGTQYNVKGE